jgi:drug/metabolite transporter (DMT)-like permease
MKLSRIFQPRKLSFWILVVLNLLSLALGHITQTYALSGLGTVIVRGLTLVNALISALLAWRLVNS